MSNEINVNLNNFINKLLPEALEKGLERSCQLIENISKENCPVDSGVLRASITHKVNKNEGVIGTNVEYAPYVHDKKPFIQDAIDGNMDGILRCFENLLKG